jgi:hypothetical protein
VREKAKEDPELYATWGRDVLYCFACGTDQMLERHHIVKQGRSDEACNLMWLCQSWNRPCHLLTESDVKDTAGLFGQAKSWLPKLSIGACLTLKWISTPAEYSAARLQELRGSRLPDPEIPAEQYLAALRRSRPELAARILEAQDLRIIPRPPEFKR